MNEDNVFYGWLCLCLRFWLLLLTMCWCGQCCVDVFVDDIDYVVLMILIFVFLKMFILLWCWRCSLRWRYVVVDDSDDKNQGCKQQWQWQQWQWQQ